MNNKIIPITLAVNDGEQQKRLEKIIAANPMVRLADEESGEMGVLIYEPGDKVDEDLPHIIHALEAGHTTDVYLAGNTADPDLLIRAMRSGIREFLHYPLDEDEFRAALMRTAMRGSLSEDQGGKGKIMTVLGAKSGLGTTTLAVNLACALNERNPGKTVLIDMRRPGGETPYFLDLAYEYTWGHLTEDISRLDATYLMSVVAEHETGLHVLPGPAGADRPDENALYLIIEQLRSIYDFVVVDTSYPHTGTSPKEVEHADRLILSLHLTLPCLARTSKLIETIRGNDPDVERRLSLVATRVAKNATIGVGEAAEVLDRQIPFVIPEDGDANLAAVNQGSPLIISYPKSVSAKAIQAMVKTLVPPQKKARKGLSLPFSSLFKRKKNDAKNDNLAGAAL